ncbi:MAG: hypothetical protein KTR15_08830, partial [Phycisphaeraceae bacterium]|nr:hypothetical protein [Phycisphaeraceae bacterium]
SRRGIIRWHPALVLALSGLLLAGCQSTPDPQPDIPLPGFADEGPAKPKGVYAVIRRADVPLEESTDEAWSIINEQVVPPVTRGTWRGNGLRIGLLKRDQLDKYSEAMPQPVAFSRQLINKSVYPVPIVQTPRLRSDLRFEVDLTRPPRPRLVETVKGGEGSTLRLLARIETRPDGQHTLVLTPQHHIPSPLNLIPRDPLEKEMDGRVYEPLSLRVTLGKDQIAVVGLHWPWPMGEAIEDEDPSEPSEPNRVTLQTSTAILAADPGDPAAPPVHLRPANDDEDEKDPSGKTPSNPATDDAQPPKPRYERIAPPLPTSFGSTLLTGTRIRQPVRTVLLITIEEPDAELPALPVE